MIDIPEGYTIEGVDQLNMNVDNESGAFIATASIADSKVKIRTEKLYKSNFVHKEKWPQMVAFLEAAYDFTQKKVIIKKK